MAKAKKAKAAAPPKATRLTVAEVKPVLREVLLAHGGERTRVQLVELIGRTELCAAVPLSALGDLRNRVDDAIELLVDEGTVRQTSHGKYQAYTEEELSTEEAEALELERRNMLAKAIQGALHLKGYRTAVRWSEDDGITIDADDLAQAIDTMPTVGEPQELCPRCDMMRPRAGGTWKRTRKGDHWNWGGRDVCPACWAEVKRERS